MAQKVDPKELILNNLPLWITYVLAIVPVVLYFVVVGGAQAAVETSQRNLDQQSSALAKMAKDVDKKDPENPVYTPQDVERFKKRKELFGTALGKLGQVVQSRDAPLEKWFQSDKWKPDMGGTMPEFSDYQVEFGKQINQLKQTFVALDPAMINTGDGLSQDKMVRFQKRFWVQQACLEALKTGGARRLISRIEFTEPTAAQQTDSTAVAKPYEPIQVRFGFEVVFTDLPKVVHALLTKEIAFRITQLTVEKTAFVIERKEPKSFTIQAPDGVFEKECEGTKFQDAPPPNVSADFWIPEPAIKVDIALEALDFRPPPKQEAPAEQPGGQ